MTICIGIDPGIVNMGVFALDKRSQRPELSAVVKIGRGNMLSRDIVPAVFREMDKIIPISYHRRSVHVAIENQMKRKMIVVQAALQAYFISKGCTVSIVHPATVKRGVGLKCEGYKRNKKNAVKFMQGKGYDLNHIKKKDDISDSYMMAYYLATK